MSGVGMCGGCFCVVGAYLLGMSVLGVCVCVFVSCVCVYLVNKCVGRVFV